MAKLTERLIAWGQNSPDPEFFDGHALCAVLGDCADAADTIAALRDIVERLVRCRDWNHDEDSSARVDYDIIAEAGRAALAKNVEG